jgi:ribonuclease Z
VELDIVFFGTSGSVPTAQRSPSALLVRRGGERLLFDCGEGTQRQMLRSNVGLVELREVFLTHYHADHYLGLPGMLKTFSLRGRELPLTIHGPPGLGELFSAMRRIFGKLSYAVELVELHPGDVLERREYNLVTFAPSHSVVSLGYALVEHARPGRFDVEAADALGVPVERRGMLQRGDSVELEDGSIVTPDAVLGPARPGRKLVLTGDTAPSSLVAEVARGAEVLVHEATFLDEESERARETMHSTALDAAEIARDAEVGLLALTHLSNRYFGPEIAREARTIFSDTVVPKDFDVVDVPFAERGVPTLVKGAAVPQRGERPAADVEVASAPVQGHAGA